MAMSESTERRRKLGWIAGAGLACLGAGSILTSGCSTTTVADHGPAKANQQVASTDKSASKKFAGRRKSTKQVAKKDVPAKVRISDLDDESRVQMAARVARQKTPGQPTAVADGSIRRPQSTQVASAPVINPAASANQAVGTNRTDSSIAARKQGSQAAGASRQRGVQAYAANTRTAGAITQTAGDGGSPPTINQRSTKSGVATRPVITPRKTEWQPENGGEVIASNHERLRADRLMQRANSMYENGYREEALRLAFVALELEKSQQAVYKRGEQRPSDFINLMQSANAGSGFDETIIASRSYTRPKSARSSSGSGINVANRLRPTLPAQENNAAEASVLPQAPRDPNPEPVNPPHFVSDDKTSPVAAANSGKVDVPVPQAPRNAEVSVVTADGGTRSLEPTPNSADARGVVTAERVEAPGDPASSPKMLLTKAPAHAPLATAADAESAEVDAASDADSPLPAATHTSQLTIASLIGLLTGVAGMIGLGWWRRQEREHYAAAK